MDRPFDSIKSSIIGATKRVMSFCPYVYIVLINNKNLLIEQTQYTWSILVAKKKESILGVYWKYKNQAHKEQKSKNWCKDFMKQNPIQPPIQKQEFQLHSSPFSILKTAVIMLFSP